jgi:hypothetical protein
MLSQLFSAILNYVCRFCYYVESFDGISVWVDVHHVYLHNARLAQQRSAHRFTAPRFQHHNWSIQSQAHVNCQVTTKVNCKGRNNREYEKKNPLIPEGTHRSGGIVLSMLQSAHLSNRGPIPGRKHIFVISPKPPRRIRSHTAFHLKPARGYIHSGAQWPERETSFILLCPLTNFQHCQFWMSLWPLS